MATLLDLISQYGVLFVFACVLVEQAGAPIPAFPALLVAGSLAAAGTHSAAAFLASAVAASLIADSLWYAAGKRFGSRVLRTLCRLSLSQDGCVRQTEAIFVRWGAPSLMLAKFIPGFASVATAMAGSTGVGRAAFLVYDGIGAALWAAVALALGWVFAAAVADVLFVLAEMGRWGLILLAAFLAAFVAARAWRRYRFHARLRMDRISVHALAQMLDRGESPLVVDVRSAHEQAQGVIPGAMLFGHHDWPDDLRPPSENAVVVVYCACPNEASAALVAQKLMQRGFRQVRPLLGGIDAWRAAGLALEHGRTPASAPSSVALTPSG
ncbi:rhodanese-like domain-containing protein [Piscinibacter sp. XHJ-5]|uniref:rhodanese-like domain-containing protein n=1 Tax=Piscinibacter sp. XHJ-5 TaxID=3037797 RepID=UPI002453452B|nr:rhodanese-like domain-containing protein [Piscinibacter sp. XHJ-5]